MSQAQIRALLPRARLLLHDKHDIKAYQLMQLLELEDTRGNRQLAGRILSFLPEWKRQTRNGRYERSDVRTASYRLSITLSETHRAFLEEQRGKFGLSYASSIRSLICQRIENSHAQAQSFSNAYDREAATARQFTKVPDAANISALNLELKALFAQRRQPCRQQQDAPK